MGTQGSRNLWKIQKNRNEKQNKREFKTEQTKVSDTGKVKQFDNVHRDAELIYLKFCFGIYPFHKGQHDCFIEMHNDIGMLAVSAKEGLRKKTLWIFSIFLYSQCDKGNFVRCVIHQLQLKWTFLFHLFFFLLCKISIMFWESAYMFCCSYTHMLLLTGVLMAPQNLPT